MIGRTGGHHWQVGLHHALDDGVVGEEPTPALGKQVHGKGKGRIRGDVG